MLQNCVEQLFDDGRVFVSKNSGFAEEFAVNIKNFLTAIENKIGVCKARNCVTVNL